MLLEHGFFVVPSPRFMGSSMAAKERRGSNPRDGGEYIEFPKSASGFRRMIRGLLMPNELSVLGRGQDMPSGCFACYGNSVRVVCHSGGLSVA